MAENSKIQWTDHTFSPWRGCTKVSPGCAHCYAETLSHRNPAVLGEWGPDGKRAIAAESAWKEPLKWDRDAKKEGVRRRVFCASLGDVFEERVDLIETRMRLFQLIGRTPHLDWLLLTKRPHVAVDNWPLWAGYWCSAQADVAAAMQKVAETHVLPNVWVGVSVEGQPQADERIRQLQKIPARVRFLSVEPLLGSLDLSGPLHLGRCESIGPKPERFRCGLPDGHDGEHTALMETKSPWFGKPRVDWVIVGGESGPRARPCDVGWVRSIVAQCHKASVPAFVKQLGANVECIDVIDAADHFPGSVRLSEAPRPNARVHLQDPKGGDPSEWPQDLQVRQLPAGVGGACG